MLIRGLGRTERNNLAQPKQLGDRQQSSGMQFPERRTLTGDVERLASPMLQGGTGDPTPNNLPPMVPSQPAQPELQQNPLSHEHTERQNRILLLHHLVERGIDTPDVIGYHATSLEAFRSYIDTGRMTGYTGYDTESSELPQPGDLYFFPFIGGLPEHPSNQDFRTKQDVLEIMERVARNIGRTHRFMTLLNLPLDRGRKDLGYIANFFPSGRSFVPPAQHSTDYEEYLYVMSLRPTQEIEQAMQEAMKAQGVVVAIGRSVLKYGMPEFVNEDSDMRINMGRIPTEDAFSGIKPMGEIEANFLTASK